MTAITGEDLELHADTICLHSDTPGAVSLAAVVARGVRCAPASRRCRWRHLVAR
ncbi:MAG: LamB/YcsF family protein [Candidatus Moduliflexus flocculans]|nr:LamB/YcsF family protein [Candidatus Moduliflexus flocculans]